MKAIKQKLPIPDDMHPGLCQIAQIFHSHGFECYLIGGSVRDLIMGSEIFDYDFATNAKPEEVMKLFKKTIPTGIKHGTVSVIISKNIYEITTYRSDGSYTDGRHPEQVSFSNSLEEDVQRRDFTINGLAYDLLEESILDLVDGYTDIEKRIIRTIGNPLERFNEDGLRPYRACRFAAKLNFEIEEQTFSAISQSIPVARKVSAERIRDELMKLMETEKPSVGLECMRKSGLLGIFLPELAESHDVIQNRYHKYDIYRHSILSCDAAPADKPFLRLAALLHDIGKAPTKRQGPGGDFTFYNHEVVGAKITRKIMRRMKFSNEQTEKVNNLIVNHMFHYTKEWTDGAVRRFIRKVGMENIENLIELRLADRKGNGARCGLPAPIEILKGKIQKVIEEDNAFSIRDLDIDGNIIMGTYNLNPGPIIGRVLNELLELVLDNPDLNRKDILVEKAGEIAERLTVKMK